MLKERGGGSIKSIENGTYGRTGLSCFKTMSWVIRTILISDMMYRQDIELDTRLSVAHVAVVDMRFAGSDRMEGIAI